MLCVHVGIGGHLEYYPYELYYRDCLTFVVKLPPHPPAFQKNIYGGHVRAVYIHGIHVRAVYIHGGHVRAVYIHGGHVRAVYIHGGHVRAIYIIAVTCAQYNDMWSFALNIQYIYTRGGPVRAIYIHGGDMRAVYKLCIVRARDHHRAQQTPPPPTPRPHPHLPYTQTHAVYLKWFGVQRKVHSHCVG